MTTPATQSAPQTAAAFPFIEWSGKVWRWHRADRDFKSARGSEIVSGRYHRARPQAPRGAIWRALYTSLDIGACLAEVIRYIGDDSAASTQGRRLSQIRVELSRVVDLREFEPPGLSLEDLTKNRDWTQPHEPTTTQQLAMTALNLGAEGLIVPAASLVGHNLVILIDNLLPTSVLEFDSFIDPNLYVPRS